MCDFEEIDLNKYHYLLQADHPSNIKLLSSPILDFDNSSASPSTLTLEYDLDYYFKSHTRYHYINNHHKRFKLSHPTFEFDLTVVHEYNNYFGILESTCDTTVSTIRSLELLDTVDHPIPVTNKQRQEYKEQRLNTPFGFVSLEQGAKSNSNLYSSTKVCPHRGSLITYVIDSDLFHEKCYWYWCPRLRVNLSKACYITSRVDKPTSIYKQTLLEKGYSQRDTFKEGFNCYSVVPVDNHSLVVSQLVKRVQFSDVTIYRSSYKHTRVDPENYPAIRNTSVEVVYQHQARTFYYYQRIKYPFGDCNFWREAASYIRLHKEGKLVNLGRLEGFHKRFWNNNHADKVYLVGEKPLEYIYANDVEGIKEQRFVRHKATILDTVPCHPFGVLHDYPRAHQKLFTRTLGTDGKYPPNCPFTPSKGWVDKYPRFLTAKQKINRRNWIFRELYRTWARAPVSTSY